MNETSGKRCAYEFFIHQSRHIGHAPELDETDLNEHDKAYAELTRVFSNCPHWELGGHAVSLLRRARCNFTTLGRRQRLLANTVRSTQVGQLVALDQSVAHTLEEIAAPGKGQNKNTHGTTIDPAKFLLFSFHVFIELNIRQSST